MPAAGGVSRRASIGTSGTNDLSRRSNHTTTRRSSITTRMGDNSMTTRMGDNSMTTLMGDDSMADFSMNDYSMEDISETSFGSPRRNAPSPSSSPLQHVLSKRTLAVALGVTMVVAFLALSGSGIPTPLPSSDSHRRPTPSAENLRELQGLAEMWRVDDLELNREGDDPGDPWTLSTTHGRAGTPILKLFASREALLPGNDAAQACKTGGGELWFEPSLGTQNGLETTALEMSPNTTSSSWSFKLFQDAGLLNQTNVYHDFKVTFCAFFGLQDELSGGIYNFRELVFTVTINREASFSTSTNIQISAALCDQDDSGSGKIVQQGRQVPFCICTDDYPATQIDSFEDLHFQQASPSSSFEAVVAGQRRPNVQDRGCSIQERRPALPAPTERSGGAAAPIAAMTQCCRMDTLLPNDFTETSFVSVTGSVLLNVAGRRRRMQVPELTTSAAKVDSPRVTEKQTFEAQIVLSSSGAAALTGVLWGAVLAVATAMTLLM